MIDDRDVFCRWVLFLKNVWEDKDWKLQDARGGGVGENHMWFWWRVSIYSNWLLSYQGVIRQLFSVIVDFLSMIGMLIWNLYEPFLQDVSGESMILRWQLRSVGLLFARYFVNYDSGIVQCWEKEKSV